MLLADNITFKDDNKPINKHLRVDANDTLKFMLRRLISLAIAPPEKLVKSCLSCDNFNEQLELCKKYGNQRPPARIIAFGCEGYDNINEDVPF